MDQAMVKRIEIELSKDAVIIGENHQKPNAREIVLELFKRGAVRVFFLEQDCKSIEAAMDQALKANDWKIVAGNDGYKFHSETPFMQSAGGSIPFWKLLKPAFDAKVPFHFFDTHPDASDFSKAQTKAGMNNRDTTMAHNFATLRGKRQGCLILVGSSHAANLQFKGEEQRSFKETLSHLSEVPFVHIIN